LSRALRAQTFSPYVAIADGFSILDRLTAVVVSFVRTPLYTSQTAVFSIMSENDNESCWIGGRITYIGSAALAPGESFALISHQEGQFGERGERQDISVRAMGEAYRNNAAIEKDPMTEAALKLELEFIFERNRDLDKISFNESAIMSTQRWSISALPITVVGQVVAVVNDYRDFLAEYSPVRNLPMTDPSFTFHELITATEKTRPDIVALVNFLLGEPPDVNCFVFSEPDGKIVEAWRGFHRSPNAGALPKLPENATASDILEYISSGKAGRIDQSCCFWCEKNVFSSRLSVCVKCRAVSYCSKECQTNDWRAFHKRECSQLVQGRTRKELGLGFSRLDYLTRPGVSFPKYPMKIARPTSSSVWRGDILMVSLTHAIVTQGKISLGPKTKFFPWGMSIVTRETQAQEAQARG
jgi:hypothetical protein